MPSLDGPRLQPRIGKARSLVVLLHGYGASGDDLLPLGQVWQSQLPDTAFVAPHAPDPIPMMAEGRQWFPLTLRDPTEYWRGVTAAGPVLDAFLNEELARYGLPGHRLALVGFSQGTMMALHVGPRRTEAPAAIVGLSGRLAGPERLAEEVRGQPPILLVHGAADEVIPVGDVHLARESLAAAGMAVTWHIAPQLGHGIDETGLHAAGNFLAQFLS